MKKRSKGEEKAEAYSKKHGGSSWLFVERAYLAGWRARGKADLAELRKTIFQQGSVRFQAIAAVRKAGK